MKKIRYLPFGYQIAQGKVIENPSEKELVVELYQRYLQGCSIKQLTQYAGQHGVPYRENSTEWNKNMITRILEDERYWNGNTYPPIISKELADKVIQIKRSKAAPYSGVLFIQKKLVCPDCGNGITRNSRKKPKIFWDCKRCHKRFGPLSDYGLLQSVENKLLEVCRNPQIAEPEQFIGSSLSMQAARLTNEINQALGQREVDPQRLLPLILECAAEKYKTCHIKESDHITINIKALFQEHGNDEKLDRELFEQTIEQVILQPDGTVQLRLLNSKIL